MALLQLPETEFDVEKLLDKLFSNTPFQRDFSFPRFAFTAPCDIYEKDGKYFAEFSVPGYDVKDISIEVTGATLTVTGSFHEASETKNAKYYKRQIARGSFMRTVTLPQDIDPQSVEASMYNGLLTLTLTPVKPIVPRKIAIKSA